MPAGHLQKPQTQLFWSLVALIPPKSLITSSHTSEFTFVELIGTMNDGVWTEDSSPTALSSPIDPSTSTSLADSDVSMGEASIAGPSSRRRQGPNPFVPNELRAQILMTPHGLISSEKKSKPVFETLDAQRTPAEIEENDMDVGDENRNNKADEGGVSLGLPALFLNSADPMNGFNAAYWGLAYNTSGSIPNSTAANGKRAVDHELSSSLAANTSLRVNENN
ncbi:hypothetical protein PPACK8108_LOCUS16987 [Phakopsora pachyrhizi]|uniref:Uncharacterized protein n=1 Tax=Phakopsora pachyrhizi TaxID=170000 RepID=A0AAV0BB20_PHAPC|nr:hypothetical protein PPACK8108_LOCUS16987 [Phakopsora pachyrhizi]